jgi:amino acid transporter
VAAKLGRAHVAFWLGGMALFFLPLAAVVIWLNREMPLEGGLYQWAKAGFNEFLGFLTAWNLWVYAVINVPGVLFVVPTDLSYMLGPRGAWLPASRVATVLLIGALTAVIVWVAVRGLALGKWLHNAGSAMVLLAYVILLPLPLFARWLGHAVSYTPVPWQTPSLDWFSLAVFGQMTIGGLSGFEYVAILAGECRNPARAIGRSVIVSAPIIVLMFILGTSTVLAFVGDQPINIIGPIPQTFRLAFGNTGPMSAIAPLAIFLLLGRAIASASLSFTGLTRLPMTAGWDHLLPNWFTALHPRWRTPTYSILFVGALIVVILLASTLGVAEQEANQVLVNASSVHYGIAYIALFAIPLFGRRDLRERLPRWAPGVAAAGLLSSVVAVLIAVHPIVNVVSQTAYAFKIAGTVAVSNAIGVWIYWSGRKARAMRLA